MLQLWCAYDVLGIFDVWNDWKLMRWVCITSKYVESLLNGLNKTLTPVGFGFSLHLQVQKQTNPLQREENMLSSSIKKHIIYSNRYGNMNECCIHWFIAGNLTFCLNFDFEHVWQQWVCQSIILVRLCSNYDVHTMYWEFMMCETNGNWWGGCVLLVNMLKACWIDWIKH